MLTQCLFLDRNSNRRRELPTRAWIIDAPKHAAIELLYWMTSELCSSSITISCDNRRHTLNAVNHWQMILQSLTHELLSRLYLHMHIHCDVYCQLFTNTYTKSLVKIIKTHTHTVTQHTRFISNTHWLHYQPKYTQTSTTNILDYNVLWLFA